MKKIIVSSKVPSPIGPYSQAVMIGNTLYTSGQIALDLQTNKLIACTIKEETRCIMGYLQSLLEEAGMTFDNVVKTTIYLKSMNDFVQVNEAYSSFFTKDFPARATIEAARLPKDANVEICVEAVK
ncbi:MAG: RidA family protein [Bacteroidetes bacterium]|nr:RidA family protein [Bacteroidota bacterium]